MEQDSPTHLKPSSDAKLLGGLFLNWDNLALRDLERIILADCIKSDSIIDSKERGITASKNGGFRWPIILESV